jgi:predicted house-cleaning NTP pyrophosphatase (Maf/HAM1 superfamily)
MLQNAEDKLNEYKAKTGSRLKILQSTVHGMYTSLCFIQKEVQACTLLKYTSVGFLRMKSTF